MAMESSTFRLSYEVVDASGNGQRVTFEQMGATEAQILELQAKVVQPCVARLTEVAASWLNTAQAKGNAQPTTPTA